MSNPAQPDHYDGLLQGIGQLLHGARQQAAQTVNTLLVQTYWHIGQHIVEFEQGGHEKADYGSGLLNRLSKDLTALHGKGFGRSNLFYMRKLYLSFSNSGTLSHKLSWSHYYEILKADEPLEISFYSRQATLENWSVRELKRQMQSLLFHRLALSKDKEGVLQLLVEYATASITNNILLAKYLLYLPDKDQLRRQLEKLLIQEQWHESIAGANSND